MARGILKKLGGALKTIAPIISFVPGVGQIAGPAMAGLGGIMGAATRRNFGKGLLEEAPGLAMSGMGLASGLGAFGPKGVAAPGATKPEMGGATMPADMPKLDPRPKAAPMQGDMAPPQSNFQAAALRRRDLNQARQQYNPGVYGGDLYG